MSLHPVGGNIPQVMPVQDEDYLEKYMSEKKPLIFLKLRDSKSPNSLKSSVLSWVQEFRDITVIIDRYRDDDTRPLLSSLIPSLERASCGEVLGFVDKRTFVLIDKIAQQNIKINKPSKYIRVLEYTRAVQNPQTNSPVFIYLYANKKVKPESNFTPLDHFLSDFSSRIKDSILKRELKREEVTTEQSVSSVTTSKTKSKVPVTALSSSKSPPETATNKTVLDLTRRPSVWDNFSNISLDLIRRPVVLNTLLANQTPVDLKNSRKTITALPPSQPTQVKAPVKIEPKNEPTAPISSTPTLSKPAFQPELPTITSFTSTTVVTNIPKPEQYGWDFGRREVKMSQSEIEKLRLDSQRWYQELEERRKVEFEKWKNLSKRAQESLDKYFVNNKDGGVTEKVTIKKWFCEYGIKFFEEFFDFTTFLEEHPKFSAVEFSIEEFINLLNELFFETPNKMETHIRKLLAKRVTSIHCEPIFFKYLKEFKNITINPRAVLQLKDTDLYDYFDFLVPRVLVIWDDQSDYTKEEEIESFYFQCKSYIHNIWLNDRIRFEPFPDWDGYRAYHGSKEFLPKLQLIRPEKVKQSKQNQTSMESKSNAQH